MAELIDKERAYTALKHEQYTHGLSFSAEAFEKAARIIDQMPTIEAEPVNRWIPCIERLPEMPIEGLDAMYSDCCLVCDSHEWIGMAYCLTDGKKTWWEFADAQNKVKIDWTEVTHWMPLPEPPKE